MDDATKRRDEAGGANGGLDMNKIINPKNDESLGGSGDISLPKCNNDDLGEVKLSLSGFSSIYNSNLNI